jgi:hypothetical protein
MSRRSHKAFKDGLIPSISTRVIAVRWSGDHSCLISKRAMFDSWVRIQFYPSVAQSGSASALGAEGRWFESSHSDQYSDRCATEAINRN